MHKIGTDGKRNSPSLCWYTLRPRSNTVHQQGRYESKRLPWKTGEPFVSWICTFTSLLLVCNGISEPSLRQIHPVGIQFVSGIPNLRKGAASVRESQPAARQ
ncbi:hypothetical protein L798_12524 [Zootermopsis nevadensis]|uniref:Uncharacterized protein n=1 Tax=Zootermopsis nevadensis TaxID=136037 RepID=A0A067QUJ4_ZOONE|nr:hypothetical protein L798_12524 [Zootermopsis nevadensis]